MNLHPSLSLPPQEHPIPLQDLSHHCPPAPVFSNLGPRLNHTPLVALHQKSHRDLSLEEQQELRRKINSRERKRMQDLNVAMDALREVMVPYASNPTNPSQTPGRRLSKISTLVLARNYILLLGSSLQEMRRLLGEVSFGMGVSSAPVPRLLLTGSWPIVSGPGQILLAQESFITPSSSLSNGKCPIGAPPGAMEAMLVPGQWGGAGGMCSCGVCRLPRFNHPASPPRFTK